MKDSIGKDPPRDDHGRVANQVYASYARALEVRNLASIIGAEEVSERDQDYLKFAEAFEQRFVGQGETTDHSIENFGLLVLAVNTYALGAMSAAYDQFDSAEAIARIGVAAGIEFDDGSGAPMTSHCVQLIEKS